MFAVNDKKARLRASLGVSYLFLLKTCSFATPKKILVEKKKAISKSL